MRSAFAKDNTVQVFADETRPRQQGARITTFELAMDGIPVTLITDGMCSYFMKKGMIDMVVVGADRIALLQLLQNIIISRSILLRLCLLLILQSLQVMKSLSKNVQEKKLLI